MIEPLWFIFGGAVAPLLAAMLFLLSVQPWRSASRFSSTAGWALAVGCGWDLGYLLLLVSKRSLPLPPVEALHLLAMAILPIILVLELIGSIQVLPIAFAWLLRLVALACVPAWLLLPYLRNTWSPGTSAVWLTGLILLFWIGRIGLHHMVKQSQESWGWLAMGMAAAGAGITMLTSGSIELGQAGLTLAMAMAGTWLAAMLIRATRSSHSLDAGLGVAWVTLVSLLLCAFFYASLSPVSGCLLAATPLSAWIARLPWMQRRRACTRAWIVILISTGIVTLAAAPSLLESLDN